MKKQTSQQAIILQTYIILVIAIIIVVVIFGTKLVSNDDIAQALKTQKQSDELWEDTDKKEFSYLGIKTIVPEHDPGHDQMNVGHNSFEWTAYPVQVMDSLNTYVVLHTDIKSYNNLIEHSILDVIYETNTAINTDIDILSIKTSQTWYDIDESLQDDQIIDRINSLNWRSNDTEDLENFENFEITKKVIDNTGIYIEMSSNGRAIVYLLDSVKNIETVIRYDSNKYDIDTIHEILNHIEIDEYSNDIDIEKIDNDFKSYFRTYTDNTVPLQQVIDNINNKINLRYDDEESLRNFDRNSVLNSTKASNYVEYQQTLTANNQKPQDIQGYKYMKSLGVYRVISTDLGKQYELVGTALPFRYYTDGGIARAAENNVTAVETKTWTQQPDINNNRIGTDFQYRVECIDTSEYTDKLSSDTMQKIIDKQKSIFDNAQAENNVYYEIQTDIESDNQAQMVVYHLTKPRTAEDFNELTDIDIIQAYKYIIETQSTSEISKNNYNLTVTVATSYRNWFGNYTNETLEAFNEWAELYKVNAFDMKDQLQTILIKEDALREEARQRAIIEAAKKASKNRKTNNKYKK